MRSLSDKVFLDPPSRVEARQEQGANGNEERDSNCPKEGSPNDANRSPSILTKEHLPYSRRSRQEERNDATHKREHSPENGGDAGDAHRSELNGRERRDWRSSWRRPGSKREREREGEESADTGHRAQKIPPLLSSFYCCVEDERDSTPRKSFLGLFEKMRICVWNNKCIKSLKVYVTYMLCTSSWNYAML